MPATRLNVRLHAAPTAARISRVDFEQVAQERLQVKLEQARAEGFEQGRAEARQASARCLDLAAQQLEEERERLHAEIAESAANLIVEIARRVLRRELEEGRYDIEAIARETLSRSGAGREGCVVHLSQQDFEELQGVPFRAGTQLEADPTLGPGDIHVSTRQGLLLREIDEILAALPGELLGMDG